MATADTEPVKVADRESWFAEFATSGRPLWVMEDRLTGVCGWLSLRAFYGRPAYRATVEVAVYISPERQRRGIGRRLLSHAITEAPAHGCKTLLAFVFGHNASSLALFSRAGFAVWGTLPGIAELDRVERDLVIMGRRLEARAGGERFS